MDDRNEASDDGNGVAAEHSAAPIETEVQEVAELLFEQYKLSVLQAEHEVQKHDERVAKAQDALDTARATLKAETKLREAAVSWMRDVIREREEPTLPFTGEQIEPTGPATLKFHPEEDRAWRDTPVEMLDLPEKLCEALREYGLLTIGLIADHTAQDGRLLDVPGIGPAKAEEVEKALEHYWEDHPRPETDGDRSEVEDDSDADAEPQRDPQSAED